MSKTSKRAISILVIATFLMSMITILPVAAIDTVSVSDHQEVTSFYTFQTENGGTAVWSQAVVHSGMDSVLLTATAGTDAARVNVTTDIEFTDLTSLSYWFYYPTNAEDAFPYLILALDTNDNMVADAWVVLQSGGEPYQPAVDTWVKWDLDVWDNFMVHGTAADGTNDTLADLQELSALDYPVVSIKVAVGEGFASSGYVDDLEINGATHRLEQLGIQEGDELAVTGTGVTAGSTVNVYWDYVLSGSIVNNTQANPDGTFDVAVDVPSDNAGFHYIWAKDVTTGETLRITDPILVLPMIDPSPSSGLVDDEIEVEGYGFSGESEVKLYFNGTKLTTTPSTVETDEDGYFTCTFDIPQSAYSTAHTLRAIDEKGFMVEEGFTVGASITLDPGEGPTGTVVTVEGRGWTATSTMSFTMDSTTVQIVEDEDDTVDSDGTFTIDVVIPNVGSVDEYSLTASETGPNDDSSEDFDITGIPEIEVSPTYGTPGATITITGSNFTQIDGTEVDIDIYDGITFVGDLVTAETDSDGSFEDTFVSPAVNFQTYTVEALDDYSIDADDTFKVGLIALIINPNYGEAGTEIAITGIGFEPGDYNLTFGDELYEEYGTGVDTGEAISDLFYIPNVEPGVYDLLISDEVDNELTVQFTVTESTTASLDPAVAPNIYNITIEGNNFADIEDGNLDFVLYNSSDDWTLNVQTTTGAGVADTETDDDGNFTGWWKVLDKDTLSLGDYTLNITDSKDLMVQLPFSIVAARVEVAPRKALFDRGDTISFDISNDFDLPDSYIEIYSPDDILYWITDDFTDGTLGPDMWVQIEGIYTVPYYRQMANENPMELQGDAPMGTWTYFFYDSDDDELMNSTFEVGPSTAAQVDALLEDVRSDLSNLADDLAGITDEIEDDIGDLAGDIADIASEVDDLKDEIVADLADDIAAVADAAEDATDAVSDLAGLVGDIADAVTDAASAADSAVDAANDAKTAAEESKTTSQGLTTLVYGAIAASLVAALAAVVSLMQISKKIA